MKDCTYYFIDDMAMKDCTYYFIDDMVNITNLDLNKVKIHEKSNKNVFIYHTEYVTVKTLAT